MIYSEGFILVDKVGSFVAMSDDSGPSLCFLPDFPCLSVMFFIEDSSHRFLCHTLYIQLILHVFILLTVKKKTLIFDVWKSAKKVYLC